MLGIFATTGSGILYALSFPTTAWYPLAWIAIVPLLASLRSGSARRALLLASLWTVVAAYGLNDWFPGAVSRYWHRAPWVGAAFFFAVTLLTAAPAFVVFAFCWRRLDRRAPTVRPLLAAAAWVGAEFLRTRVLGDPWALLGYAAVPTPIWLQTADLGGIYTTSFVLAAGNAALAELWLARKDGATARARALRGVFLVAGVAAATACYGTIRTGGLARGDVPAVLVAVVQPNLDLGTQWRAEFYGRNLDAYLRLTLDAVRHQPPPRLVVWPETAMSFFLDAEPSYRAAIARVIGPSGTDLLAGGPRNTAGAMRSFHNSAFLLRPDGAIAAWYDKRDLLPFAEHFPWTASSLQRRDFGDVREFTAGAARPPLPASAGRFGAVICNEALFAEPAALRATEGAQVLVALANDSWVGAPKYAEQALAMTVARAVEQRRWVIRASTSGPSAIVDPTGRVVIRTAASSSAVLTGEVRTRNGLTLYARAGDAFALVCGLCALIAFVPARPPVGSDRDRQPW